MTDTKHSADLPPLPAPLYLGGDEAYGDIVYGYCADQMRAYARAAIAAAAAAPKALAVKNETGLPLLINLTGMEGGDTTTISVAMDHGAAPKAALTDEKVFPLSVLEEIAQAHADSVPGPGGYACTQSEKEAFKRAFLKRWMPKAIEAASGPNAALVEALQYALLHLRGEEADTDGAERKIRAALAAAGVKTP